MIQLGQQGHLHTKTVELEKVKKNRTALIRIRTTRKDFEIVKVHFVTRGTRVGKHTGLSGVRGMFYRNRRDTLVL